MFVHGVTVACESEGRRRRRRTRRKRRKRRRRERERFLVAPAEKRSREATVNFSGRSGTNHALKSVIEVNLRQASGQAGR